MDSFLCVPFPLVELEEPEGAPPAVIVGKGLLKWSAHPPDVQRMSYGSGLTANRQVAGPAVVTLVADPEVEGTKAEAEEAALAIPMMTLQRPDLRVKCVKKITS